MLYVKLLSISLINCISLKDNPHLTQYTRSDDNVQRIIYDTCSALSSAMWESHPVCLCDVCHFMKSQCISAVNVIFSNQTSFPAPFSNKKSNLESCLVGTPSQSESAL